MLEVLFHFPAIFDSIESYLAMPVERRTLFQEFVLKKREEEIHLAGGKLEKKLLQ